MQVTGDIKEAEFWFMRGGNRYYARQDDDMIILLNSYDCGEKVRFSVDKLQRDIIKGEITDYGIN